LPETRQCLRRYPTRRMRRVWPGEAEAQEFALPRLRYWS